MSLLLFPLGFYDATVYNKFADELQISRVSPHDFKLDLETQYYSNRSRCSILQLDLPLIIVLKYMYPEYDGIISPVKLPNILKNGHHHSELCVFDKKNILLIKEIPRIIQLGGNMKPTDSIPTVGAISLDNEITREYTKSMKDFHKTFKLLPINNIVENQNISSIASTTYYNNGSINFPKKGIKTRKRKNI